MGKMRLKRSKEQKPEGWFEIEFASDNGIPSSVTVNDWRGEMWGVFGSPDQMVFAVLSDAAQVWTEYEKDQCPGCLQGGNYLASVALCMGEEMKSFLSQETISVLREMEPAFGSGIKH